MTSEDKFTEKQNLYSLKLPLMLEEREDFKLSTAMNILGGFGNFQKFQLLLLSMVWFIVPSIPMMIPFYRMSSDAICIFTNSHGQIITRKCNTEEYCNNKIEKIFTNKHQNFESWDTDFHLNCENKFYYGIIASFYFLGILIGFFFTPYFSDKYGRRFTIIYLLELYFFLSICIIFFGRFELLFLFLFLIGVVYSGTSMPAFLLNYESSTKEYKVLITTLISMSFGASVLCNIYLFWVFQNWKIVVGISTAITAIVLIGSIKYLQESPELLFNHKNYTELKKVLQYIAKENNKEDEINIYLNRCFRFSELSFKDDGINCLNDNPKPKSHGIFKIFSYRNHLLKIIIMCFNWFVMSLTFYGINFNINNFGFDIYLTGFIVYSSEVISQYISMFVINLIGDKYSAILYYASTGIALVVINFLSSEGHLGIFKIALIFIAKFSISAVNCINYIYTARIFPIEIRSGSMSFFKILSRFGALFSTLLIEVCSFSMFVMGACNIITAFIISILEEESFDL